MSSRQSSFRVLYGAGALHLLATLASLAFAAFVVSVFGLSSLWNPDVWWQSVLVWFIGAAIAHDLVLFPAYAVADRVLHRGLRSGGPRTKRPAPEVSPLNYVRVPVLAVGLLFLMFFPGIIQQGQASFLRATGLTQEPYLQRWLLLSAAIFLVSALAYAVRLVRATRRAA